MSSADRQRIMRELFPEEYKAVEEKAERNLKRSRIMLTSEMCLMYGHEQMGDKLARLAQDGYWSDQVGNTDSPGHQAQLSVYESEERYRDVMAQVAMFLNENGQIYYGGAVARRVNRPDLDKRPTRKSTGEDKKASAQSQEQHGDEIAQDKDEVEGEVGPDYEVDTQEPVGSEEHSEDEEAETSGLDPEPKDDSREPAGNEEHAEDEEEAIPPRAHMLTYPRNGDGGRWPPGGFADDDSAAPYIVHVIRYRSNSVGPFLPLNHVKLVSNPETGASDPREYLQVTRLREPEADCNFWFPHPRKPGFKMGKVDCSAIGLATIVQAVWAVVVNYDDAGSIPSLQEQIGPLDEANGAMYYVRPIEHVHRYFAMVEPFKPQGIRAALEVLQSAGRKSTAGKVIFYVNPVDIRTREGRMCAVLDIHPITGGQD
ncbi:hypothetical protein DHEL01_v211184 [Diaporthe helianthi]|uniref:Uncharacterized protein n=1 Tax=Diaporthe helianthi TaxID=158607 RepID=A0A2P5HJN6_DIAHE|nr:hypothetical protein DHEL01_v211184 [Diaporthe helianthi]